MSVDEWDEVVDLVAPAAEAEASTSEPPQSYYANVDAFVREFLIHAYSRRIDQKTRKWNPRWWTSTEAVCRLEALWRAWEHLRLDPHTGMSRWWRDHADHHMLVLMDPDGPFQGVQPDKFNVTSCGQSLPYAPPPTDMFTS